ncbi:MAG TPA: lysophospholipid acyltransferase family protein [Cytophagaceae bacterium]
MKNLLGKIYAGWCIFWFLLVFLLIYPFFLLFLSREKWYPYGHFLNKLWAHVVFAACALPTKIEFRFKPEKGKSYVYCANHTSYLDIPTLCYSLPGYFVFVGKASLAKVPLFGYMFRTLYIQVDRRSQKSRYETMIKSLEAIDKKRSLAIFPEGTIPNVNNPQMIPFKDGAFRTAIEKKVPIVPISIINNWKILPDESVIPRRMVMKAIIHEPIDTQDLTLDDVNMLKEKTYSIIDQELRKHHPEAFLEKVVESK